MQEGCCRSRLAAARGSPSPFGRLVAAGYYDGPTEGLAECAGCGAVYTFRLLDWDDGQDLRIFAMAPAGTGGLEDLLRLPGSAGDVVPSWPVWVLLVGRAPAVDARVDELLRAAGPEQWVVAAESLLGWVVAAQPLGDGRPADWFRELGLARSGRR